MTYQPTEQRFGPCLRVWLPSVAYMLGAVVVTVLVMMAEANPERGPFFRYLVEQGQTGWLSSRALSILLLVGGAASLARAAMRGVRIWPGGLEYRDVISWTWPKVRRFRWAQIDRILLDQGETIVLELWDGSRASLPEVANREGLAVLLERVAAARSIPVRGGRGLDEIPEPEEDQDPA